MCLVLKHLACECRGGRHGGGCRKETDRLQVQCQRVLRGYFWVLYGLSGHKNDMERHPGFLINHKADRNVWPILWKYITSSTSCKSFMEWIEKNHPLFIFWIFHRRTFFELFWVEIDILDESPLQISIRTPSRQIFSPTSFSHTGGYGNWQSNSMMAQNRPWTLTKNNYNGPSILRWLKSCSVSMESRKWVLLREVG